MRIFIAAVLATISLISPAYAGPAKPDPKAALEALKSLNLVVFDTLTTNGQEVEGKTFTTNLAASNWTNFGIGNANQGAATSDYAVLSVVNNVTGPIRLKAGYANGTNGVVGTTALIGGNVNQFDFNTNGNNKGSLIVGGNLTGGMNVNNNIVRYGGTAVGGINGAVKDSSLAKGGANDVSASLSLQMASLQTNLTGLSSYLSTLTPISTITSTSAALDYSSAKNGYAVFTMSSLAFQDQNANFDNLFSKVPSGMTTIINVLGTNLTERGNLNSKLLNQSVIWNFSEATSLSLKGWHGTVLAPLASLVNSSAIEGTIVAKNMTLNGEVHLGTYNGSSAFLPTGVPEPATWGMMIGGFMMAGGMLRLRKTGAVA